MEAKRDAFEDLYRNSLGRANWYEQISREAQTWLKELAEYITKKDGRYPVWTVVHKRFGELFPDEQPKTPGTIADTVRRLRG